MIPMTITAIMAPEPDRQRKDGEILFSVTYLSNICFYILHCNMFTTSSLQAACSILAIG